VLRIRRLIAFSGLYGASAILLKLAGAGVFFWLARSMSVDDYAAFGLLYALQQGLATFALAGIVEAVIAFPEVHGTADAGVELFASANLSFLLMATCSATVAFIWTLLFRSDASPIGSASVIGGGLLLAFASLQAQLLRLKENHVGSLSFSGLAPLAALAGGMVGVGVAATAPAYFEGSVIGAASAFLLLKSRGVGIWSLPARLGNARAILGAAIPFIAVAVLGWLSGYGNNYVVEFLFPRSEIARFTFALTVSSVMQLAATSLNQVWSPRFFRSLREAAPAEVEKVNRQFYRLQSVVLGVVGGAAIGLYPTLIRFFGGNLLAYQHMTLELLLLFAAYLFLCPWWQCYNYYLAYGQGRELVRIVLLTSVVGLAVWLALMWWIGPLGIYLGFLAQMVLRSLGIILAARKKWPIAIAWDGVVVGAILTVAGFEVSTL